MKNNYSFFLFCQLYNVIHPNETPYDILFEELEELFYDYVESLYNDSDIGEYECMVEFLNACKELIITPANDDSSNLLIDRTKFIEWFFDQDMIETFVVDYDVIGSLIIQGSFTVTAKELLETVGYIPEVVLSDLQKKIYLNEDDEVDTSKYSKIKFV